MHPCFASASQISESVAPKPYEPPTDTPQPQQHEICSKPSKPPVDSDGAKPFIQPDTESKSLLGDPGAKPVYLKLRDDDAWEPPENPTSIYIQSGVGFSDPQILSGKVLCPIDGSPMTIVGSQHGAWICAANSHQWDLVNQAPMSFYGSSGTLPTGNAAGDQSGVENL